VSELCASRWLSLKESTHFLETRLMKTTGNPAEAGHADEIKIILIDYRLRS